MANHSSWCLRITARRITQCRRELLILILLIKGIERVNSTDFDSVVVGDVMCRQPNTRTLSPIHASPARRSKTIPNMNGMIQGRAGTLSSEPGIANQYLENSAEFSGWNSSITHMKILTQITAKRLTHINAPLALRPSQPVRPSATAYAAVER